MARLVFDLGRGTHRNIGRRARAGPPHTCRAPTVCSRVPGVRPVAAWNADGLRGRAGRGAASPGRRAAGEPRGKRRIHQKPNAVEIAACRPRLDAALALVGPQVLVCLGATAAQALLGRSFRVTRSRGKPVPSSLAPVVLATVHPSSILRAPDEAARRPERKLFVRDLAIAARFLS